MNIIEEVQKINKKAVADYKKVVEYYQRTRAEKISDGCSVQEAVEIIDRIPSAALALVGAEMVIRHSLKTLSPAERKKTVEEMTTIHERTIEKMNRVRYAAEQNLRSVAWNAVVKAAGCA